MFEKQTLGLPCPKCGHKTEKTVAWIKAHDDFTCEGCNSVVRMEKEKLLSGIKQAEDSIAKLRKKLSRIGKR
jgi:transcription initiation factor IIE alpha subunit